MKTNYKYMTESEKILSILEVLGAVSPETAVTTEKMIDKGIELGATEDMFTENWHGHKEGDHPWWLLLAPMSGVGPEGEVEKYNVPFLHRQKISSEKNGRKTKVYVYWYDESFKHENTFTGKVYREKIARKQYISELIQKTKGVPATKEEAMQSKINNPEYVKIGEKFILKSWLKANPEKGQQLYGMWFKFNPEVYKEVYGESQSA